VGLTSASFSSFNAAIAGKIPGNLNKIPFLRYSELFVYAEIQLMVKNRSFSSLVLLSEAPGVLHPSGAYFS
jgi:hypothetical protein